MKTNSLTRAAAIAAATACTLAMVAPVYAAPRDKQQSTESASADGKDPAMQKQYCVKMPMTGSHLMKKICKSRADWISEDNYDPAQEQ